MPYVAKQGSTISHGGSIIDPGQTRFNEDGVLIAVHDATVICALHLTQKVIAVRNKTIDGVPIAVIGDLTTCGATIITGSGKVSVD